MIGVLINSGLIIIGSLLGLLLNKYLKEKVLTTIFHGMGLCVVYLGIKDALSINHALYAIIALSIGGLIGESIDLDALFTNAINKISKSSNNSAFTSSTILFCSGSMAVIGSIQAGLYHDYSILISKGVIDCVASIILTSKKGKGIIFSSISVLVYQGVICLCSTVLAPLVSNEILMNDMIGVGSLILLAVGFNMLEITKIKTMNLLPSMVVIIILNLIS